ncbi:MAG: hypothetical protein P8H03_08935 [Emcibacteraceae bacterium]|nr:hypothetical protein [Emcibacteraceae bacterium]MDG1858656.1 hypothetical protein [Emcibacteraceae bacterium]
MNKSTTKVNGKAAATNIPAADEVTSPPQLDEAITDRRATPMKRGEDRKSKEFRKEMVS